jgi:hypothetical protein
MKFDEVKALKMRLREEAIAKLQAEARAGGQSDDRAFWSMVYDFEMAPMTTNRRQLAEIGVEVPDSATLSDEALASKLAEITAALERLHVFLLHGEHLPPRVLYERLERDVLDEEVRDVPPLEGVREYVDLASLEELDALDAAKLAEGREARPLAPTDAAHRSA